VEARFLRDAHGYPRCEVAPPHEALGGFLEQDVQSGPRGIAELLHTVDGIAAGRQPGVSGTGNAFLLTLSAGGAEIECLWDESMPVCRVSLAEFRQALVGWQRLVGGAAADAEPGAAPDPAA
jgi:hypothetical protein